MAFVLPVVVCVVTVQIMEPNPDIREADAARHRAAEIGGELAELYARYQEQPHSLDPAWRESREELLAKYERLTADKNAA